MPDELITSAPVDNPRITVDRDDNELTIHIEGKQKPRLPAPVVTFLIVWGFAAFVCPGVLLVTLLLIPVALIAAAVIYFTRPEILTSTVETETVLITPEEILFSRDSIKYDDDNESPEIALCRKKLKSVEFFDGSEDDDTPPKLLFTDDDGTHHSVGTILPAPKEKADDDYRSRELKWLATIVDIHLAQLDP